MVRACHPMAAEEVEVHLSGIEVHLTQDHTLTATVQEVHQQVQVPAPVASSLVLIMAPLGFDPHFAAAKETTNLTIISMAVVHSKEVVVEAGEVVVEAVGVSKVYNVFRK